MSPGPPPGIDIDRLTLLLAPPNNAYRIAVKARAPALEILEIMWDAGDVMAREGVSRPGPVASAIYGRLGEARRSYITRDFTLSCWRVRRFFDRREDIRGRFPGLKGHNLFKLALPLLDNEKYALHGKDREDLIALLSSGRPPAEIRGEITAQKRARIPRRAAAKKNPGLEAAVRQVIARHSELAEINATGNRRRLLALGKRLGEENLLLLSRLCLSLFSEEFAVPPGLDPARADDIAGVWRRFFKAVVPVVTAGPASRNRLRGKTGRIVYMEMAETLGAAYRARFPA